MGGGGCVLEVKSQSAKICLNFNFLGEGVCVLEVKFQSAKICLNFNFQRGGEGVLNQIPEQGVVRNLSTNFALPLSGSFCITDSLSHTTYVETKNISKYNFFRLRAAEQERKAWESSCQIGKINWAAWDYQDFFYDIRVTQINFLNLHRFNGHSTQFHST